MEDIIYKRETTLKEDAHELFTTVHDIFMNDSDKWLPGTDGNSLSKLLSDIDQNIYVALTDLRKARRKALEERMQNIAIASLALVIALRRQDVTND